jgi:hypothetical protein
MAGPGSIRDRAQAHDQELHDHDRGLSHDLPTLLSRRALMMFGGAGLATALAGCGTARSNGLPR